MGGRHGPRGRVTVSSGSDCRGAFAPWPSQQQPVCSPPSPEHLLGVTLKTGDSPSALHNEWEVLKVLPPGAYTF